MSQEFKKKKLHNSAKGPNLRAISSVPIPPPTLEEQLEHYKENYERLLLQASRALLKTLELRDSYTYGHSMRVMEYAMLIGRGADLTNDQMRELEIAAMFHDIGKIGISDCVLLKPERLNAQEQAEMMKHAAMSAEIIEIVDEFRCGAPGAKHHHERFDGHGYPAGLSGDKIPLPSRIILVADTFDAMTSNRPYRKALPIDVAYEELVRYSGIQFDPQYVDVFLREHQRLLRKKAA